MKYGTESLETIADFLVDLTSQFVKSLKDGKISGNEKVGFIPIGFKLPAVVLSFANAVKELSDLEEVESIALIEHIAFRLKTNDLAVAEDIAKSGLAMLFAIKTFYDNVKAIS